MSKLCAVPAFADLVQPGREQQEAGHTALPWCLDPGVGRSRAWGWGGSSCFVSALCAVHKLQEESQLMLFTVVASGCAHWPAGKRSKTINSFSFPMQQLDGESIDLIWEPELTKPYPQSLICSHVLLETKSTWELALNAACVAASRRIAVKVNAETGALVRPSLGWMYPGQVGHHLGCCGQRTRVFNLLKESGLAGLYDFKSNFGFLLPYPCSNLQVNMIWGDVKSWFKAPHPTADILSSPVPCGTPVCFLWRE